MKTVRVVAEVEATLENYSSDQPRYAFFDLSTERLNAMQDIAKSIDVLSKKHPEIHSRHTIIDTIFGDIDEERTRVTWSNNFSPQGPLFTQIASTYFSVTAKEGDLPDYSTYPCPLIRAEEAFMKGEEIIFIGDDEDEVKAWYYVKRPRPKCRPL